MRKSAMLFGPYLSYIIFFLQRVNVYQLLWENKALYQDERTLSVTILIALLGFMIGLTKGGFGGLGALLTPILWLVLPVVSAYQRLFSHSASCKVGSFAEGNSTRRICFRSSSRRSFSGTSNMTA